MNRIIQLGRNYIAISDHVEADCHKHWMLQMFLRDQGELNIDVNGQRIPCDALLVNMDTSHTFSTEGEPQLTALIDPTTTLGRAMRGLLKDQPCYRIPRERACALRQAFGDVRTYLSREAILALAERIDAQFITGHEKDLDSRVKDVLLLLGDCAHDDESHQMKYFSDKTGLSESRLAHLFKWETGIPLKSYIVLHKLQKAYESIFNGESITTAALGAGFDSPSHLAYTHRMMTGMTASNLTKDSEFLKVF